MKKGMKIMKKLLRKIEFKKFEKLVNDKDSVLFTQGNEIEYVYNKRTNKKYYPSQYIEVVR